MPKHKEWLERAEGDLRTAQLIFNTRDAVIFNGLYFTQQSAEKALKAFLIFSNKTPPKTHDLSGLVEDCMKIDPAFITLMKHATDLSPFCVGTRYPDSYLPIPSLELLEASIQSAKMVLDFVKDRVDER